LLLSGWCAIANMAGGVSEVSSGYRVLVLGGTRFVGRALVEAGLDKGYQLTLFNRGRTNPELFDGVVETVRGDRTDDLSALAGRRWDAVVDVAAYHPAVVDRSLAALGGAAHRYLFVSTVSVYADQRIPAAEGAPVLELEDPSDDSPDSYGARKAACEDLVREALGDRATVVRPGLIVGPHDPTDRFSYWPRRVAEGGVVLGPGQPSDPLQFIDVRDLATFILRLLEDDRSGTFNATGHTVEFGHLLNACRQVCASEAEIVWVPGEILLEAGLDPWVGVPLWIGDPAWHAANRVVIGRALEAGLEFRHLDDTIRGALNSEPPLQPTTFDRAAEARLLQRVLAP
jgi:2'-hydroxyisoflavone reductase